MVTAAEAFGPVKQLDIPADPALPGLPGKFSLSVVDSDATPFWPGFGIAVLGAPGKGKTHLMATLSKDYPETWPPPAPVLIEDVLVINTDQNGLAPFREAGVTFKHVIDISGASAEDCFKMTKTLPGFLCDEIRKRPEVKVAVFDHISGFFEMVLFHIIAKATKDGPKMYNDLAKVGKDFFLAVKEKVRVPMVYNCHIKASKMHLEAMAGGGSVEATIKSQILASGKGRDTADYAIGGSQLAEVIRNTMSLSAYLKVQELPGNKMQRELSFTDEDIYTKRRLTLCVDKSEPADLGKLFDKISLTVKQSWR